MQPRRKSVNTPIRKAHVAVSYSPSVGGAFGEKFFLAMNKIGTECSAVDYRNIVPVNSRIEEIFSDGMLFWEIFSRAKNKAEDQLNAMDCDCLIIPGNNKMVDPRMYGKPRRNNIDLPRTIAEMALIHSAMQRGIPILGVCGGNQIINVFLGGTLKSLSEESFRKQGYCDFSPIIIDETSMLADSKTRHGLEKRHVFGAHQQAIAMPGGREMIGSDGSDLLKVVAVACDDEESIEGVESEYGAPVIGLQFHPEIDPDDIHNKKIFQMLKISAETARNRKMVNRKLQKKYCHFDLTIEKEEKENQIESDFQSGDDKVHWGKVFREIPRSGPKKISVFDNSQLLFHSRGEEKEAVENLFYEWKIKKLRHECDVYEAYLLLKMPHTQEKFAAEIQKKLVAIKTVKASLDTDENFVDKLDQFSRVLEGNRDIIEKNRDSAGIIFLKVAASILSLGLAVFFGIWRSRGYDTLKKLEAIGVSSNGFTVPGQKAS